MFDDRNKSKLYNWFFIFIRIHLIILLLHNNRLLEFIDVKLIKIVNISVFCL